MENLQLTLFAETGFYPYDIGGVATVAYIISYPFLKGKGNLNLIIRKPRLGTFGQLISFFKSTFNNIPNVKFVKKMPTPNDIHDILEMVSKSDIIHFNSPPVTLNSFFVPYIAKKQSKKILTITIHGGLLYELSDPLSYALRSYFRNIIKTFDKIIVLNTFSKKLVEKVGISHDKIEIIPNGIDISFIEKFKPIELEGDPRIIYMGRLSKIKGVDILILAFKKVVMKYPNAKLYILGTGPEEQKLKMLVIKNELANNVEFLGALPLPPYNYLKSVDLFVLPSYNENFSIALIEAMASKVAIIAADNPGNYSVLNGGKYGILFKRGDPNDLAAKIFYALENKDTIHQIVERAYKYVKENLSIEIIAEKYFKLFKTLSTL